MRLRPLSRDTLLDLTVNVVPLVILVFFTLFFIVVNPWGWDPFVVTLTHFLIVFPLVLLALLSYLGGLLVDQDEAGG